jgi:hypothetical protein
MTLSIRNDVLEWRPPGITSKSSRKFAKHIPLNANNFAPRSQVRVEREKL